MQALEHVDQLQAGTAATACRPLSTGYTTQMVQASNKLKAIAAVQRQESEGTQQQLMLAHFLAKASVCLLNQSLHTCVCVCACFTEVSSLHMAAPDI